MLICNIKKKKKIVLVKLSFIKKFSSYHIEKTVLKDSWNKRSGGGAITIITKQLIV